MAKAEMKMPEDFLLKISKLGSNFDSVADTVLQAGGEVVLKRVKSNLSSVIGRGTKIKSRTTGELEGALGLSPSKLNRDGNHDIKVSSAEFGLHIEKKDVFSAPEYDAEFISIPGRSGDIINPNRRFANIKVTYTVFLARKNIAALAAVLRDIKGWLYSEPDRYHELTDSYDAEYFRYGVISGNLDIEEQLNKVGSFTVTFNCKPFKYSFAGQQTVSADASELTITNPTAFESRPYIKLYGSGTVVIMIQPQGRGMMISNLDEYIEIDSELMNCSKGTALKNDTVKGTEFPVFKPGVCTINCTGNVTRIEVIPRWCCL